MASDALVGAALAEVTVVGVLYGIFFILFCASTFLLVQRQAQLKESGNTAYTRVYLTVPFIGGILLFASNTTFWVLLVYRIFRGLIWYNGGTQAAEYFADSTEPTAIATGAMAMIGTIVGDAILIYRMSIVWKYRLPLIVPPVLGWLAYIACSVGVAYTMAHPGPPHTSVYRIWHWVIGTCSASILINVYCCGLIGWKIWHNRPRDSGALARGASMISVFITLIESAALLVIVTIAYVATYTAGPFPQSIIAGGVVPSAGIAFMLINMRVGLGYVRPFAGADEITSWQVADAQILDGRPSGLGPIAVDIRREVDIEYDEEEAKVGEHIDR